MVISRVLRRLLLVSALCLPMQMLPTEPGIQYDKLGTGLTAPVSMLGQLFYPFCSAALGIGSAILSTKGLALLTAYAAPKLYNSLKSTPETAKVSKGSTGHWLKRAFYTVRDQAKETWRQYRNLLGYATTKTYNTPTYLKGCLNTWLEWDKTNNADNRTAALELYKEKNGVNRTSSIPSLDIAIMGSDKNAVEAYLDSDSGLYACEFDFSDNKGRRSGITGLMLASRFGHKDIAQRFAQYGWNINHQDSRGTSALMHAVFIPNATFVQINRLKQSDVKRGEEAEKGVIQNKTELVAELLAKGAKVQALDEEGRNALMYAARAGLCEATEMIAKAMEDQRFDINHQDRSGRTALVHAVEGFRVGIVKLLVGRKFNAHINKGADKTNVLHDISYSDALEVARKKMYQIDVMLTHATVANLPQWKALVESGVRIDDGDQQNLNAMRVAHLRTMSPVFIAKYKNMFEIVAVLEAASRDGAAHGDITFGDDAANHDLLGLLTDVNMNKSGNDFDDAAFGLDSVLPQPQLQTGASGGNVQVDIIHLDQPRPQQVATSVAPAASAVGRRPGSQATSAVAQGAAAGAEQIRIRRTSGEILLVDQARYQIIKKTCVDEGRTEEVFNEDGSISFIRPDQVNAHRIQLQASLSQRRQNANSGRPQRRQNAAQRQPLAAVAEDQPGQRQGEE